MGLDVSSKHGIIIGVVTILITLPMLIHNVPRMMKDLNLEDPAAEHSPNYQSGILHFGIFCLLASVFAVLLIWGIVKKCQWLLVPWLVVELVFSVMVTDYHFDGYHFILVLSVFQAIFLYPICNLFVEIRRKNTAVQCSY